MNLFRAVLGSCIVTLFFLMIATEANAQEQGELTVSEMKFCKGVENRTPVDVDTVFADTVGVVYCFTRIEGARDTTWVTHTWYHGTEKRADVRLGVASKKWRTWSSKRILPEWTGDWKVEVRDETGTVLASARFSIRKQ